MRTSTTWRAGLLAATLFACAALAAPFKAIAFDGWNADEIALLSSLSISELPPVPADPSNAYAANPAAARLGERIFSDPRFSGNGKVSCATCHQPQRQFQDGLPLGQGMGTGTRRSMPLAGAAHSPFLFWDGRKDSLWSQALGPLEDPLEHGSNRLALAHLMARHYRDDYQALFGALPDLSHLPEQASPLGTAAQRAAWAGMSKADRHHVSRVFANLGKAIAAFERGLTPSASRMDRYVEGLVRRDPQSIALLNPQEKNGLRLFIGKGQCVTCHNGPLLSDQHFHNTGIAPRPGQAADAGRQAAIARLRADEFNCLGRYSDAAAEQCQELRFLADDDHAMDGAFKTPSLRNVALRAPYMHAGQIATLEEVVRHYAQAPAAVRGHSELKPAPLNAQEQKDLNAFLATLNALGAHQGELK